MIEFTYLHKTYIYLSFCTEIITGLPNKYSQRVVLKSIRYQEPVVQSIVSLTISLRHKVVKQISAKVTNTLLFFVEKM